MTIKRCFKSACCLLSLLCHCLHRQSTAAAAALLVSLSCPPTSGKAERYCQEKGVSTRAVELRRANRGASKEELLRGGGSSRAQRLVGIPRNTIIEARRVTRQSPDEVVAFKDCNQSYLQCLHFLLGRKWREKKTDHSAIGGETLLSSRENAEKIHRVG
ncbi:hypothetical protein LAZ67_2004161 [Cordylochernes scorpioides]|uniref:Uncharacterized protein n=1 Tax=Cordylochernes scorpioides TaxID=51811 RepID=A0ABY6K3P4_9ARAC|nr:hypothetical protein LAZ67_2004161 [Cordylochernes scorpioides]